MKKQRRPFFALSSIALLLLASSGCSNSQSDDGSSPKGNADMVLTYEGVSRNCDVTEVRSANSMYFDDSYFNTAIGGWVQKDPVDFGTCTFKLQLQVPRNETVQEGTYALTHEDSGVEGPHAIFYASDGFPEGAPSTLYGRSGQLVVETMKFEGTRVTELAYRFEGEFSEYSSPKEAESEGASDTTFHKVSGRVRFKN